ncbi:hypothetical protein ACSBOB_08270 [Mesorhizobium sp. ASY16-5R]|uniref:hypothetical protein n=1 Tax=Mesorhizobium sp. ASY16-5R TaxID=3445772 RepID=UPI003FA06C56
MDRGHADQGLPREQLSQAGVFRQRASRRKAARLWCFKHVTQANTGSIGRKQWRLNSFFIREKKRQKADRQTTMTASMTFADSDRRLVPHERNRILPSLALRRRSSDHPMAMFAVAAGAAFISMAVTPSSGTAFASFDRPAVAGGEVKTTAKTSRLPVRESSNPCQGQSWGEESYDCLVQIAIESGKTDAVRVRKLALAGSPAATTTVF